MPILKYTICFCRSGDLVLMLRRRKPPFVGKWHGLGGKIEAGEAPLSSARREVLEEAGIDLYSATRVRSTGVVTWAFRGRKGTGGMHAFVAEFPRNGPVWDGEIPMPEGKLCWKPLGWICDPDNPNVVDSIPWFLPSMLRVESPMEYRCDYAGRKLAGVYPRPITAG